ncbi:glycoside hydrolase family 44 protein [Paenibacillus radicis (ex Xue et al. 2023)]|uniref:Glycoside hydrolase family 44 catalytic domain-containing protein n=1 Tax=Paenibacillus radicis (ex Xue et al. 2023) TaxID=2972489 RepID=A0ABT1YA00_9BACL|nr:glycoside hydrolase family 44 protein [Paenibacillus radicis (ex Xue et al. 2023)]MCR8630003.1 hypothetical protein [Paenibacillus radicis (ex Xue et al. 2023)]
MAIIHAKKIRCFVALLVFMSLLASFAATGVKADAVNEQMIYKDALSPGISDHSWADHALNESKTVHTGSRSIRLNPSMDGALYLYSANPFLVSEYNTLEFWIHGGEAGGQKLNLIVQAGGEQAAKLDLAAYLPDGRVTAGVWQKVQLDLTQLKIPNGVYDGIVLMDQSHTRQGDVYLDDVRVFYSKIPVSNKPPVPVKEQTVVYDDALNQGFLHFGSPLISKLNDSTTVHSGVYSVSLIPDEWEGLYLYKDRVLNTNEFTTLEFWIHGGTSGGQQLDMVIQAGGVPLRTQHVNDYLPDSLVAANVWQKISVPLSELNLPNGLMDGIVFKGRLPGQQSKLYLDDIKFIKETYLQPKVKEIVFPVPSIQMYAGNSEPSLLTANYDNGYTERVTANVYWASTRPDIAVVDNNGTIKALQSGSSVLTATYENLNASLQVNVIQVDSEIVYDDELQNNYANWSWGTVELNERDVVHSGNRSIRFLPRWWQGVYLDHDEDYEVKDYYGFEFYIHGGDDGRQKIRFVVQDMNSILGSVVLNDIMPRGIEAGKWNKVTVRLADLGITEGYFDSLVFQAWDWKEQEPVYIDDVKLLRYKDRVQNPKPPVNEVSIQIDTNANRKPVNPDIYGVNFEEIEPKDMSPFSKYPVVRWGGNSTTRYNWELNVQNHASDWFFMNLPKENSPNTQLPNGSRTDQLIDQTLSNGGKVLLTVPTIGWTPKERKVDVGFSVKKYGSQQQTECAWGEWWCNPDAGNGVKTNGQYVKGNDPKDTSKEIGPEFVSRWIGHIQSRVGNKVNYYALDNEPMLWPYTHRDVHPQMTTYDEVWGYTQAYGQAIKEKDPSGKIFGPVVWGWCAYFYSASDGCSPGPDMQAHDGKPFLEWYLSKVKAYEDRTGTRLLDYLDIHYYPTEAGVALSTDESNSIAARRLKSLKALYDPKFKDSSSWIGEPVNLIPRMKEMISKTAPGTKLAITEYNFGNGKGISSGLAQAEAMAIFGREGVDLATRWGQPLANTSVEDAFKLFLDYDGKGSRINGDSVKTVSTNADMLGAYSIHGADGKVYILLFNKDTLPKKASINITGTSLRQGEVYRFDAGHRLGRVGALQLEDSFIIDVPERSATLIVCSP